MPSHPHPPITYRRTVLSEAQHKQVHLVLSAPADAEAKTLCAFLQLHREVIKVLRKIYRQLIQQHTTMMRTIRKTLSTVWWHNYKPKNKYIYTVST